ncbi:MAG: acetylxylan esterase [Planctomycetes bacterium]|nr:acetylxylan esterase [Planctomycetota bacterium]
MDQDRRQFLETLGAATLGGLLASSSQAGDPMPLPDPARDLRPSSADLGSLYADVERLAANRPYEYSYLGQRFRDFAEFKRTAREKLFELLLYRPDATPPRAEVVERVERDTHIREKVLFSTSPHFRVPAYVLIPRKRTGRAPAIVDLHSHGGMFLFGKEKVIDLGRDHAAMTDYHRRNYDGRPTATELVRRGFVVISIDAFMFGERRLIMDADLNLGWDRSRYSLDDVRTLNQACRYKETTLAKALTWAGLTWPGIVFWDDIRTVDYLASRPEVDANRIGCLGISMGGYRACFLAALDERIKAACVTGFMSTFRPMIQTHVDTHSWVHFVPGLQKYLDLPDVAMLTAPRSLLVQQCQQDRLFPLAGMRASLDRIGEGFAKAGAKDRFTGRFYDVAHIFTRRMQDDAIDWLERELRK